MGSIRATERIELPHRSAWVDVKAHRSIGDRKAYNAVLFATVTPAELKAAAADDEAPEGLSFTAIQEANQILVERSIVAWSWDELPTIEAIREWLDDDSADLIVQRLKVLYADRTEGDRKNSEAAGQTQSSTGAATQPSSPESL